MLFSSKILGQFKPSRQNKSIIVDFWAIFSEYFRFISFIDDIIMKGTKFQLKVWNYLKKIPKGEVRTYKQVAMAIKMPKSFRAVANACAKNPYAPKIPCHRVIRSDGSLGGYSALGGLKTKKKMLKKEGFSL